MKFQTLLYITVIFSAFHSCVTERKFDSSLQNALFSTGYHPNSDEKVSTQGYYLPYDINCNKFLNGNGFRLFDSGLVSKVHLYFNAISRDSMTLNNDKIVNISAVEDAYGEGPKGGIYKISGDTLIIDYYSIKSSNIFRDYWTIETSKYKIIDNETLEEIPTAYDEKGKLRRTFCGLRVYRFAPATKLPNEFVSGARNHKWMWQNEEDWKAYKKARDEYKKSLWRQTP